MAEKTAIKMTQTQGKREPANDDLHVVEEIKAGFSYIRVTDATQKKRINPLDILMRIDTKSTSKQ